MPQSSSAQPRAPLIIFGLMTLATMAGPFAIVLTIQGGQSREWPPDRPVEWWTFGLVVGAVVALMGACLTVGFWSRPKRSS